MKLVILDGYAENPGDLSWDWLKDLVDEVDVYDVTPPALVLERSAGADILVSNKTVLSADTIRALPDLKCILLLSTGYNVIDGKAARERGIPVCNIPAYSTNGVAQLVFALLLELTTAVGLHNDSVKSGDWVRSKHFCYWKQPLTELWGKTFGIFGFGRIGKAVAQIANAMGMRVLAVSPHTRSYDGFGSVEFVDLDTLLHESDVVSLHCPLTPATTALVNADFLKKMKPTAYLINTSRGPVVDEAALAAALQSGRLAGAGVDVLSCEPPKADNPLLQCKTCIITPHIAWASFEARSRLMEIFKGNLEAFLAGQPRNVVNE